MIQDENGEFEYYCSSNISAMPDNMYTPFKPLAFNKSKRLLSYLKRQAKTLNIPKGGVIEGSIGGTIFTTNSTNNYVFSLDCKSIVNDGIKNCYWSHDPRS